ncbi:MAG TPA: hypothetical protein VNO21_13495, partial [Polyangiaceae bacterium]|nr:hypothetical protein [Polyangiaceae bacterium]
MRKLVKCFGWFVVTASAGASIACSDAASGSATPKTLVGTWTFSGNVPNSLRATLTFNDDKTFKLVENLAPVTSPAGSHDPDCVTTDVYLGTYEETTSGATNLLTWTFAGGTRNTVSGCTDASLDS